MALKHRREFAGSSTLQGSSSTPTRSETDNLIDHSGSQAANGSRRHRSQSASENLDILVNHAGIYQPMETTEATSIERWNKILNINLTSAFLGAKTALPARKKSGKAAIVNISSIAGIVGGNGAPYSASKAGMLLLTKDQAIEFAPFNIRVNSINPGGVMTTMVEPSLPTYPAILAGMMKAMFPLGRLGEANEIGQGPLLLAAVDAYL